MAVAVLSSSLTLFCAFLNPPLQVETRGSTLAAAPSRSLYLNTDWSQNTKACVSAEPGGTQGVAGLQSAEAEDLQEAGHLLASFRLPWMYAGKQQMRKTTGMSESQLEEQSSWVQWYKIVQSRTLGLWGADKCVGIGPLYMVAGPLLQKATWIL